ncbi:MAG: tRNA (adenosine(37)-N6)-threonylcarbamoyltransferase complex ATPase subunit type 1 TsaE [Ruminococcaceae bacterium]|nr:tRNA (adenosine(37)-N6)-threonylcarbamoyltransferase complex ATPase subunit type 1 TsaE [Oscillospiraceae bacterium]
MMYKSNSVRETQNIAKAFAKGLKPGDVVCLSGDLGTGKTAFVQGMAMGLSIEDMVNSPTFTIVNCYSGRLPVYHFDVYRISDPDEMYEIGYEEYVYGDGVCIIEWPEQIAEILPKERYDIKIEKNLEVHEDFREITIDKIG